MPGPRFTPQVQVQLVPGAPRIPRVRTLVWSLISSKLQSCPAPAPELHPGVPISALSHLGTLEMPHSSSHPAGASSAKSGWELVVEQEPEKRPCLPGTCELTWPSPIRDSRQVPWGELTGRGSHSRHGGHPWETTSSRNLQQGGNRPCQGSELGKACICVS